MISKEETIHILEIELKAERFVRKCFDEDQNSKVAEALEMAITALKFNPQAAREAIDEIINTAQSQPERPKGRWECVYDEMLGETEVTCSHCKDKRTIKGCYVSHDGE